MKQILLLIILCAFSTKFYGQKVTTTKVKFENIDTLVYRDVDVRASFTKAEAGWRKFLVQNLNSMVLVDAGAPSGTYTVLVTL